MATLVAVGSGINVGQITLETQDWIESADKVLYCVSDAATERLIVRLNPSAETLYAFYDEGKRRNETYEAMVNRTIACLELHELVVVVYYGHPGFFVYPSHRAICLAREAGHKAIMVPAVSSFDCMIADLGVNAAQGVQIYEATDLMLRQRLLDPASHIMILQVSALGDLYYSYQGFDHRNLSSLQQYLLETYPKDFSVTAYYAAQFPSVPPKISEVAIAELTIEHVKSISTLYIPQFRPAPIHLSRMDEYGIREVLLADRRLVPINISLDELE